VVTAALKRAAPHRAMGRLSRVAARLGQRAEAAVAFRPARHQGSHGQLSPGHGPELACHRIFTVFQFRLFNNFQKKSNKFKKSHKFIEIQKNAN
jgi:hypothetical protein